MSTEHREPILRCKSHECVETVMKSVYDSLHSPADLPSLAKGLSCRLGSHLDQLVESCRAETGMSLEDATESVEAALDLLQHFDSSPPLEVSAACPSVGDRNLQIRTAPWGVVLVILPRNAFLFLAITCLLNALRAGNGVVIRVPGGKMGSAELLAECLPECSRVAFVGADAGMLLEAFCESTVPGLVHYFGGSGRIPSLFTATFESGKALIADGEGNTWAFVDQSANAEEAAHMLVEGATRYGGRTCTSINGALIHPAAYAQTVDHLTRAFRDLSPIEFGDPVDALGAIAAAAESGGTILVGGQVHASQATPTLVADPNRDSLLVRHGVFGPVLWIASGDAAEFRRRWAANRFPLCAAVIGDDVDVDAWTELGNLARLVVNGDPSLEDPLEPWGGYPSTGNNPVSGWYEKYRRTVQIDLP